MNERHNDEGYTIDYNYNEKQWGLIYSVSYYEERELSEVEDNKFEVDLNFFIQCKIGKYWLKGKTIKTQTSLIVITENLETLWKEILFS